MAPFPRWSYKKDSFTSPVHVDVSKVWLLLWFEFFKEMDLLLSIARDASVRFGVIYMLLKSNPIGKLKVMTDFSLQ